MSHSIPITSLPPPALKKLKLPNGSEEPSEFERELLDITQAVHDSTDQTWDRPPLPSSFEDISFQQLDAEEYHDRGNTYARFFGITQEGHSVLCNVTGFIHYFYCPVPKGFEENLTEFTNYLKATFDGIERVEITSKESIWGYSNNIKTSFFKIFAKNNISKIRSAFQNGQVHNIDPCITYDNINYLLRLMIDCKITGMSWITLPRDKYKIVNNKISTCQIECSIDYRDLISHPPEGEWLKMAPLRILSFDIECAGRKGVFPEAEHDPVIQIANVVQKSGESKPFVRRHVDALERIHHQSRS